MLASWQPNFRLALNPFQQVLVWIHFPESPVEYYDKESLFKITKKVGKPIRVDYATNHLTKARYARVFVEINISHPLITKVWVGNQWQGIFTKIFNFCVFIVEGWAISKIFVQNFKVNDKVRNTNLLRLIHAFCHMSLTQFSLCPNI